MPTGSRGLQEALTPVPSSTRASWLRVQERHPPAPKAARGQLQGGQRIPPVTPLLLGGTKARIQPTKPTLRSSGSPSRTGDQQPGGAQAGTEGHQDKHSGSSQHLSSPQPHTDLTPCCWPQAQPFRADTGARGSARSCGQF